MARKRKRPLAVSAVVVKVATAADIPSTSSDTSGSNTVSGTIKDAFGRGDTSVRVLAAKAPSEEIRHSQENNDGNRAHGERSQSDENGDDSDVVPEIPWALRPLSPAPEHVSEPAMAGSLATSNDNDSAIDEDEGKEEEENEESTDADRGTTSMARGAGVEKWKVHPDRRKNGMRASSGGVGSRGARNGKGSGSGGSAGNNSGRSGGTRGHRAGSGHYGPQENISTAPCTVFTPAEGKVRPLKGSAALVVGLDAGEQLSFLGSARVRCGRGLADISGYVLTPVAWGPYVEAHSPRWMSLQVIRALHIEEHSHIETLRVAPTRSRGSDGEDADLEGEVEEAVDDMPEIFAVVVVLRPLQNGPLNFLSAQGDADSLYAPASAAHRGRGPTVLAAPELAAALHLPGMQVVLSESPGLHPLTVPPDWADVVDELVRAPSLISAGSGISVLVCGAKGVGKSTFCRLLVNRMLGRHARVAFMDCDLGQPEFTTPGLVSIHRLDAPVLGPPHSNIRRPELAYFIGTTTSKPEPLLYSAAVRALAAHAAAADQDAASLASDSPPAPLVVNTDGWVKGMGEDLLGAVVDAVRPRHIVMILGHSAAKHFDLDRLPEGCEVHRVGAYSAPMEPPGGAATPPLPCTQDLRTLRLVSYFVGREGEGYAAGHAGDDDASSPERIARDDGRKAGASTSVVWPGGACVRGGALYDQQHAVAALLSTRRPRRVPWRAVQIRVMNGPVPPNLVLYAINGALVGLLAGPRNGGVAAGGDHRVAGEGLMCLTETPSAPCVGLGIVRSVDVENQVLYVLTPEPLEVLKRVNVLVKGSLQLPMEMLYDPNWCSHPYFSAEAVGGEVIKSRNYLLRRT